MKLIQNVTLVNPYGQYKNGTWDILVENKEIRKIGKNLAIECGECIDGTGLFAFPSFVDMHVHLRDPGYEYKEDIITGSRAAVCGGYSHIACMPNTDPVNDSLEITKYIIEKARNVDQAVVLPIASITKGLKGEALCEFGMLREAGAVAFSDDGRPVQNAFLMKEAFLKAQNLNGLLISHCEDLDLLQGGVMNQGTRSEELGLPGIDRNAEEVMAGRDMILAGNTGGKLHLAHVSTKGNVELIRQAKQRGVDVTAETCPHYFSADESWVTASNTNAKMNPPLRTKADVEAIIEGIKDGTIDILSTDHAPHSAEEKQKDFLLAPMGIIGLETAFSLAVTNLVVPGHLGLEELVGLMSYRPAKRLGIPGGVLAEGLAANITLADPFETYILSEQDLHSKSKNTPFLGKKLKGRVHCTMINGNIKFKR